MSRTRCPTPDAAMAGAAADYDVEAKRLFTRFRVMAHTIASGQRHVRIAVHTPWKRTRNKRGHLVWMEVCREPFERAYTTGVCAICTSPESVDTHSPCVRR